MRILSVFKTPLIKTPRPRRLLSALEANHDVFYICPPEINEQSDDRRFGYLYRQPQSKFTRWLTKTAIKLKCFSIASRLESGKYHIPPISDGEFDIIFVHDLYLLPKFTGLKNTRVIFDAREYYPTEFADDPQWAVTTGKVAEYTCKRYMPLSDQVMTVSLSLVSLYQQLLNRKVIFFPSYPKLSYLIQPEFRSLTKPIRFVHHGNAFKNRGLERMIELMEVLGENYYLDMMLVAAPGNDYYVRLQERVSSMKNVNIIEPVHPDHITQACSRYDFGLYLMSVNESQNRFCLPNKYFEFLYSGLPVITSFSRDMKRLTDEYNLGLGFLDESIEEIARAIHSIDDKAYQQYLLSLSKIVPTWNVDNNIKKNFPELC
ncbi:hypothetical protein [Alteromonas facilis]|uniref:hypothetical protein n=1 Tax=Alteromonas facilis TaxID=2048004 RepID=UPI000C293004|nr:hypothetical protein [Alteromonas facilis]